MDIYEYAKSIDYAADYYDMPSGNIYKIQEYGSVKDNPDARIRIVDGTTGATIGEARKMNDEES